MPRRTESRHRPLALAALLLLPALIAVQAAPLCRPLAQADRETVVADIALDDTHTLLGLDGSRIKTWQPMLEVATGLRATALPWAERVDWSVYRAPAGARIGRTVLRFERSADGVRHLCALSTYPANIVTQALAAPDDALPPPDTETRFRYDDAGRLSSYDVQARPWNGAKVPPARHCLRYDPQGWLAETSTGACDGQPRPQARYVHDAAGRLLRVIFYLESNAAGQDQAREVVVYDQQGQPAQRYRRQAIPLADESTVLGPPHRALATSNAILVLDGPAWRSPALESYHYDWAIVQSQDGEAGALYQAKRNPAALLANGNSGNGGVFNMTAAQRQRIWETARQHPGNVHWLWAPGQISTLVTAMTAQAWAACANPSDRRADACAPR